MNDSIRIQGFSVSIEDVETAIVVPEVAIKEAGYIKTFTRKDSGHAKHEYHALSQMVFFQFQDDELKFREIDSSVTISCGTEHVDVVDGLIIYRDLGGELHVLVHKLQNRKKLLETAYRYCTRWVRLDI